MINILIIGAGPAGLTGAYTLLRHKKDCNILLLEKDSQVGGLSKTLDFDGNRVDIGGHRYFSQNKAVTDLWNEILPMQEGAMQIRKRKSHILYGGNCIEYPIRFSWDLFKALGFRRTCKIIFSYLMAQCMKREITSLEDYYIKQFGKTLYTLFFKNYTEKLWGMQAKDLSADWGSQRVKGVSLKLLFSNAFNRNHYESERSIVEEFKYPEYGSGQMWNAMSQKIQRLGARVELNSQVVSLTYDMNKISSVSYMREGVIYHIKPDVIISSMPIADMILCTNQCPETVKNIAANLQYRDMMIVAVCIKKSDAGIALKKYKNDCWIYLQDEKVLACRLQILNNWSGHMAADNDCYLLELEYFCTKQSKLWNSNDENILEQAVYDLQQSLILSNTATVGVINHFIKRIEKAYPVYAGAYYQLQTIRDWVDKVSNLICVGRNGQHHYNNMDHSMETAMAAAELIFENDKVKERVWNINNGPQYHEYAYRV